MLISVSTGNLLLLQPLTVAMATLSLLSHPSLLSVEKDLISQEHKVTKYEICEQNSSQETCDSLIERLVSKMSVQKRSGKYFELVK